MARVKIIRTVGDVREHPRYSVEDAARYLRIPLSTMRAWVSGYHRRSRATSIIRHFEPIILPADKKRNLLSFYNLAEAHVLRSTRDRNVPLANVRRAIEFMRQSFETRHPLISHDFETSGKEVFLQHLGHTINASKHGQMVMRDVLDRYLKKIDRDENGMPTQFSPINSSHIAINPRLSSGNPVLRGTGIMVSILASRKESGESIPELAQDFGLPTFDIEQAIKEYAA
jgi:uncharacterized protein (DUF433 family)